MFTYNSKFSVKKPINDVFKSIFEIPENKEKSVEEDNINDNVYKVIEWDINNWSIINGKRRKLENIYIYVNDNENRNEPDAGHCLYCMYTTLLMIKSG